jgi:hypothetical protein
MAPPIPTGRAKWRCIGAASGAFKVLARRHSAGHGLDRGSGGGTKVFWFFSSEKNKFFFLERKKQRTFGSCAGFQIR